MEVGKLTVTLREKTGHKGASRQLRSTGKVPGVCYGASTDGRIEPLPITVDVRALRASLDPIRKHNTVISLTIEGGAQNVQLSALVKEYQIHPVRREITHVDLIAVDPNKEVTSTVPLEFTGKPKGAIDGGQIRIVLRNLELRAKPADIPVKINVDVSPLEIGDVIHVSSIELPAGVTTITGRDLAVATCAAPEEDKTPVADAAAADPAAAAAPAAGAKAPAAAKGAAPAAGAKGAAPAAAGGKAAAKPAAKPAPKK
ncbi:MAG: 50S ribosomal protein L25 [Myxococcota bacterium]|nr:50S ribosomal protein L25 [Myxococcota bacterium]